MSWVWLAARLLKFVAVAALGAGTLGLVASPSLETRLRLLYGATIPGVVGTWLAGWVLMKQSGRQLHEPWILLGLAASALGVHAAFLLAHAGHRLRLPRLTGGLAVGGLFAATGAMVGRSEGTLMLTTVGLGLGLLFGERLTARASGPPDSAASAAMWRGFAAVAALEGVSLLVLLVAMPLRVGTGLSLDAGTGALGWLHGVLFLVYLQAMSSTGRHLGWSLARGAVGMAAALVPFGTFFFVPRVRPQPAFDAPEGRQ